MWASATVYLGTIVAVAGLGLSLKPASWLRVRTRTRGILVCAAGVLLAAIGLFLPVYDHRVSQPQTRLDGFAPAWQFREFHTIRIAASPPQVFEAIKRVRADEVLLFRTLTWIRRGGRQGPRSIVNPGTQDSLIDVATRSGFVLLADDAPRELVIGAIVLAPPGARARLTPDVFQKALPPGFALAAMNFVVTPDGPGASLVSTETRVFASGAAARRQFAGYWRVIYPGSAIIRRMWLRAIRQRAESPATAGSTLAR